MKIFDISKNSYYLCKCKYDMKKNNSVICAIRVTRLI